MVKGELKGKALAKVNQQAAEEFNDAALEACQHCGRYTHVYTGSVITAISVQVVYLLP